MAGREPPAITLTSTTTPPVTHTTTTSYTIGGRRNRNTNAASTTNNLSPVSQTEDDGGALEPFPSVPTSYETATPGINSNRNSDYFTQPPLQYQVRQRPIGIRRLPSSADTTSTEIQRQRSNSGLRRRRTNTGPKEPPSDNATAGLAGLPGHYEVGNPGPMGTIVEGQESQHGPPQTPGQNPDQDQTQSPQTGGSTRLRRASNAARSILSKLSDDPEEASRRGRSQTGYGRNYESDVVDYLDVLGKS